MSLHGGVTTIDRQRVTGHPATLLGGEPDGHLGDIFRQLGERRLRLLGLEPVLWHRQLGICMLSVPAGFHVLVEGGAYSRGRWR